MRTSVARIMRATQAPKTINPFITSLASKRLLAAPRSTPTLTAISQLTTRPISPLANQSANLVFAQPKSRAKIKVHNSLEIGLIVVIALICLDEYLRREHKEEQNVSKSYPYDPNNLDEYNKKIKDFKGPSDASRKRGLPKPNLLMRQDVLDPYGDNQGGLCMGLVSVWLDYDKRQQDFFEELRKIGNDVIHQKPLEEKQWKFIKKILNEQTKGKFWSDIEKNSEGNISNIDISFEEKLENPFCYIGFNIPEISSKIANKIFEQMENTEASQGKISLLSIENSKDGHVLGWIRTKQGGELIYDVIKDMIEIEQSQFSLYDPNIGVYSGNRYKVQSNLHRLFQVYAIKELDFQIACYGSVPKSP